MRMTKVAAAAIATLVLAIVFGLAFLSTWRRRS